MQNRKYITHSTTLPINFSVISLQRKTRTLNIKDTRRITVYTVIYTA